MPESSTESPTIKCPICGREVSLDDPQSPFCSERCRLLDLGNWASGRYTIAARAFDQPEEIANLEERPSDEGE